MSETQRGPTPQTPGSLLMNVHGDGAGHFTELRLMEGEQRAKRRPRVAAQARSRSVLSVLLTGDKGRMDNSFYLLRLLPHLGAASKGSLSAGPRSPTFLHQRGVY